MGRFLDVYNPAAKKKGTGRILQAISETPTAAMTAAVASLPPLKTTTPAVSTPVAPLTTEPVSYTYDQIVKGLESSTGAVEKHSSAYDSLIKSYGATTDNVSSVLASKYGGKLQADGSLLFGDQASLDAYKADTQSLSDHYSAYDTAWQEYKKWYDLYTGFDYEAESKRIAENLKAAEADLRKASVQAKYEPTKNNQNKASEAQAKVDQLKAQKEQLDTAIQGKKSYDEYERIKTLEPRKIERANAKLSQQISTLNAKLKEQEKSLDYPGMAETQAELARLTNEKRQNERDLNLHNRQKDSEAKTAAYAELAKKDDFKTYANAGAAKAGQMTGAMGDIPVNAVHYYRDNKHPLYLSMKQEEVDTYDYLLGKGDADGAQEYLEHILETLNQRIGAKKAQEIKQIENPIARTAAYAGQALKAGADSALQGTAQLFRDEQAATSSTQFASQELSKDLTGVSKNMYDALYTVGNQAPSILVSMATGVPLAGLATLSTSAAGNAYSQALSEGYKPGEAKAYGALVGASEGLTQYLLGGITKLGGKMMPKIAARLADVDDIFKTTAAQLLVVSPLSEIGEEELQLFIEPMLKELILGAEFEGPSFREMADTAITTYLSTLVLEGSTTTVDSAVNKAAQLADRVVSQLQRKDAPVQVPAGLRESVSKPLISTHQVMAVKNDPKALEELGVVTESRTDKDIVEEIRGKLTLLEVTRKIVDAATEQVKAVDEAQAVPYNETVETDNATVLNRGASAYITKAGLPQAEAETAAGIVQDLIDGKHVHDNQLKKLNLESPVFREVFTELTGVEIPEIASKVQLRALARSAKNVVRDTEVTETPSAQNKVQAAVPETPSAQNKVQGPVLGIAETLESETLESETPTAVSVVSEVAQESEDGFLSFEDFAEAYQQELGQTMTEEQLRAGYEKYKAYDSETAVIDGRTVTRAQFRQEANQNPAMEDVSPDMIEELFNRARDEGGNLNLEGEQNGREEAGLRPESGDRTSRWAQRVAPGQRGVGVEARTGEAETGRSGSAQETRGADSRKPGVSALPDGRGRRLSTAEEGIPQGTNRKTFQKPAEDTWDAETRALVEEGKARGIEVVPILGEMELRDSGGVFTARGAIREDGTKMWVRIDHPEYTGRQIFYHERAHFLIGLNGRPQVLKALVKEVKKDFGGKTGIRMLDNLVKSYTAAYFTDSKGNPTAGADYILEEVFCDAYADMALPGLEGTEYGANPLVGIMIEVLDSLKKQTRTTTTKASGTRASYSSIVNTFFGDEPVSMAALENGDYKNTQSYKDYVAQCLNNMRQSRGSKFDAKAAQAEIEASIEGIVRVAVASKKAGYDIADSKAGRSIRDSKKRLLFSSLEPNSDYFTSNDISTICDKRKNFAEIYDAIVRREEELNIPKGKRFFDNVDNYFYLHKVLADKGLTQPCRQCYVESMRKNLTPMANAFMRLVGETDSNNTANDQLYHQDGKDKGKLKTDNAELREKVLEALESYGMTPAELNVIKLTTADGLAELKLQAPLVYEAFNSFYGQSKPKMPKAATPFRFGELTALLTDHKGKIKQSVVNKIMSTGGFRLQSYSDFQIQNFVDVLQVIFEAGTLGLNGHAYTKVPAFLDATKGTNLKRNISIFLYRDGDVWRLDRNDSFPYALDEIYGLVNGDMSGNTSIIAVSQNTDMSAWIMANDSVGYGIPFHKSGMKMDTVRDTDVVTEDGRVVKGYSGTKDHTKQQTEVWAKTNGDNKAGTKVKKGIDIYSFWDFENKGNLSKNELIEKNVKAYIDACDAKGYLPKFREYVMDNADVLNAVLEYAKEMGFAAQDATVADISFQYKGYTIPYGYYKFLGDFGMFTPDGKAAPQEVLSLKNYDFDAAVEFFRDAETLRRKEILQQFSNGTVREQYRNSELATEELAAEVDKLRDEVVGEVVRASRDPEERRRALRKGEMVNSFRDKIHWPSYYQKIIRDEYNPDYFDDGSVAYMELNGQLLKLEMQTNGEWSVIDVEDNIYGSTNQNGKSNAGQDGQSGVSGKRSNDGDMGDAESERPLDSGDGSEQSAEGKPNRERNDTRGAEVHPVRTSRDSEGRELSPGQQEFFKDSAVRDEQGNLTPVYHGTPTGGFTEFKLPQYLSRLMSAQGAGFYFTDKKNARQYMKGVNKSTSGTKQLYKVYLNITNPLVITEKPGVSITKEQFKEVVRRGNYEWFRTNGLPHQAGGDRAVNKTLAFEDLLDKWTDKVFRGAYYDSDVLAEMTCAFQGGDAILAAMKDVLGYDGVRDTDKYGDIWVAWSPSQIKSTDNLNPTNNPDIRFSRDSETDKPQWLSGLAIDDLIADIKRELAALGMEVDDEILLEDFEEIANDLDEILEDDTSIEEVSEEYDVEPEVIEILFRRAGLGDAYVEDSKKAVMTEARIDQRIREHSSSNPSYARRYITRISPKDFIDLTVTKHGLERKNFDAYVGGDFGSRMGEWDYEKQLRDSEEPPVLLINKATGQVIGHNGRHRIRALEMAGTESIEIEVQLHDEDGYMIKYGAETIPDLAISSQFDTKIETHLSNIIPLNKAHRGEILASYGETAHPGAAVKYSKDVQLDEETRRAFISQFDRQYGKGAAEYLFDTPAKMARAMERAAKREQKAQESKTAAESLEKLKKENLITGFLIHEKKQIRKVQQQAKTQKERLIAEKTQAVREAVSQTKEVERATAAVDKQALEMNLKRDAAKRLHRRDSEIKETKEQNKAKLRLQRKAAKRALRDRNAVERKRNQITEEHGTVPVLRQLPRDKTYLEQLREKADALRTKGRDAYREFVARSAEIEWFGRRQTQGTKASTLVTVLGASSSTVDHIVMTGLVDRSGNRIADSFKDVMLMTNEKGKPDAAKQKLLHDYMSLLHTVDRMSIKSRALQRLEAFETENPWLRDMDPKELALLAGMTEKEAEKLGKSEARELALRYDAVMQGYLKAEDKPVLPDDEGHPVSAEMAREWAEKLEAENPWLKESAEAIYEWWDTFMQEWAVGQTISAEEYARVKQMYPHYIPTYREDIGTSGAYAGNGSASVKKAMQKATGSLRPLAPMEDSFASLIGKIVSISRTNDLFMNIIDTAMLDADGLFSDMAVFDWDWQEGEYGDVLETGALLNGESKEELDEVSKRGLSLDNGEYRLTAWRDGRKYSAVISEAMYKSIADTTQNTSGELATWATKIGRVLTSPMKTAITGINPFFAIRNVMRDVPTGIVNSVSGLALPKYIGKAIAEMKQGSENWQAFKALGGTHSTQYNNENGFVKGVKGDNLVGKTIEGIGWLNNGTEAMTRFAEYLATIDRLGDSPENRLLAIKNAAEVTVDFSRSGRSGTVINAWVPYWNPAIQGIDKLWRNLYESPEGAAIWRNAVRKLGRAAAVSIIPEAILYVILKIFDRDDEWEELDDRTKDTYYCIPLKDEHKFLKIPKSREWGAVLGTPFMRILEGIEGRENAFENYAETSLEPNFLPPAIFRIDFENGGFTSDVLGMSWMNELARNEDFAGRRIVPYELESVAKADQFTKETSMFGRALGQLINFSPEQIDYIIEDYFGDFGSLFTELTSPAMWEGGFLDGTVDAVVKKFVSDNRYSNYSVSTYYDTLDALEQTVAGHKVHMDGDAYKSTKEYQVQQALSKKYGKQITELNKTVRGLPNGAEKDAAKEELAQLAKEAMVFYDLSMEGKIDNPVLRVEYDQYPTAVSNELIRLNEYAEDYAFEPEPSPGAKYNDPKSSRKEYILDDAAKDQYKAIYAEEYAERFLDLANKSRYRDANDAKKAELLEDMRDDVTEATRDRILDWLAKNRKSTDKKKK